MAAELTVVRAELRYVNPDICEKGPDGKLFGGVIGSKSDRRGTTIKRTVDFHDAKSLGLHLKPDCLDTHGSTIVPLQSKVSDYRDLDQIRNIYLPEVKEAIRRQFPDAKYILVPEFHNIRSEDPAYEGKRSGRSMFTHAYARFAHLDSGPLSAKGARASLRAGFGLTREEVDAMDVAMVNVWKPWSHTVVQNPLACLDAQTLQFEKESALFHFNNGQTPPEHNPNTQLVESTTHRWLYWRHLQVDEALLFKQMDTRQAGNPGFARHCFHTAFYDPTAAPDAPGRRSIEFFCTVGFPRATAASAKL